MEKNSKEEIIEIINFKHKKEFIINSRFANFGCGNKPLKGFENYDKFYKGENIKYIDLEKLPLPFPDETFHVIHCSHVLEHLNIDERKLIAEFKRILKKDGILTLILPTWSNSNEHKSWYHSKYYYGREGSYNCIGDDKIMKVDKIKGNMKNRIRLKLFLYRLFCFLRDMSIYEYEYIFIKE